MVKEVALNILILDDHELIINGIRTQLSKEFTEAHFDVFMKGQDVINILKEKRHDLYIIDIELKDITGIEIIKKIRKKYPDSLILVNTLHEEIWYIKELKTLHINGILFKSNCCKKLNIAVNEILNGNSFFCDKYKEMNNVGEKYNNHLIDESFSKHEYDILYMIGKGLTIKEIAAAKVWSVKTVEHYRKRLFDKFGVPNVSRLIALAIKEGFLKKEDI